MKESEYKTFAENLTEKDRIPRGHKLFYKCGVCDELLPSIPDDNMQCTCGNIQVDVDYFRISVNQMQKFKILEKLNS